MPSSDDTLRTALGLSPAAGRLYERLVPQSGMSVEDIAEGLHLPVAGLLERVRPLVEHDIVILAGDRMLVTPPIEAVGRLLTTTAAGAAVAHQRLQEIAAALPLLAGGTGRPTEVDARLDPIDGEVVLGSLGPDSFRTIVNQTSGDILMLRPDQWMLPYEDELAARIAEAVAAGRRCRAIYPLKVLTEAPGALARRAAIGEEVRLVPELPTRLLIFASTHVVMPDPLGFAASPRLLVRQRGIVELAVLYFDELWRHATAVGEQEVGPEDVRRFLLEALASGAQDEQIARRLGLSLRTVRRRVAELMADLGAHSRFQAGVEATRRGWL